MGGTERADERPGEIEAKGVGEEVHRRLSGHGFSPEERRAKEEFGVRFLAGGPNGLTSLHPEPLLFEGVFFILYPQ
jgi:hypothetical protein